MGALWSGLGPSTSVLGTYLYLSNFFRVIVCTLYLSLKNVLVPKYITKYLVLEDKYIGSISVLFKKKHIIIYFFSYSL